MAFEARKYYYGDIPGGEAGGAIVISNEWPLWEVFIRSKQGLDHKHVGSLHATDARMAIEHARDVYTRRQESFYEPSNDKVYRHPTFYDLPDEIKHM